MGGGGAGGGPDEGTMRGAPRSKPYHSSLHSYLGKEGFALPGRDGEMEGGWGGEMRRTGGPLKGGGGGVWRDNWGIKAKQIKREKEEDLS